MSFVRTQESIKDNLDYPLTEKFGFVHMNSKAYVRLKMCS